MDSIQTDIIQMNMKIYKYNNCGTTIVSTVQDYTYKLNNSLENEQTQTQTNTNYNDIYNIINVLQKIKYTIININVPHKDLPSINVSDYIHETRYIDYLITKAISRCMTIHSMRIEQQLKYELPIFECDIIIDNIVLKFTRTCKYIQTSNPQKSTYIYIDNLCDENNSCIKSTSFVFNSLGNDLLGIYNVTKLDYPYNYMSNPDCRYIRHMYSHNILKLINNIYNLIEHTCDIEHI